jgi:hypothetical protein
VKSRTGRVCLALCAAALVSAGLLAADKGDELANLAAELVKKRAEVEKLSTELDLKKTQLREDLRSLATQKGEIEVKIKQRELQLGKIEQDLKKLNGRISEKEVAKSELQPIVLARIEALKAHIRKGIPFKVTERIAELDKVKEMMVNNKIGPERALARLWSLLESEFRMTNENGLYRQSIVLGGESQLADVVKLGTALMYFRTFDERVGTVVRTTGGWEYRLAGTRDDEKRIEYLFDSLKKHIREGFFELPNPLPEEK